MSKLVRWFPAILMMALIYLASATPSDELPNYGFWDTLIKKGGHMTGYGLLASAYWYGLGFDPKKGWLAWVGSAGTAVGVTAWGCSAVGVACWAGELAGAAAVAAALVAAED